MSLIEKIAQAVAPLILHKFDAETLEEAEQWEQRAYHQNDRQTFHDIAQAALTAIMGEGDGVQEDRDRAARYEGFASWDEADLEASTATMKRIRNMAESYADVRLTAAAAERARIMAGLREQNNGYIEDVPGT